MICSLCQHDNTADAAFCTECGAAIAHRCASCGAATPIHARFCPRCGHAQAPATAPDAGSQSTAVAPEAEGERRLLTAMFCDLVDSTELSQRLDAEELRAVISAYQKTCVEVIERFGGQVAQYLGDGLLVYFGYPQAHEDDAARAVDAALKILERMPRLNAELAAGTSAVRDSPLRVRIALHTGPVVVGRMGYGERQEDLALGDTLNIAARLQGMAAAQTAVVSAATHRLVGDAFHFEELGTRQLRGVDEPVAVWRVVAERSGRPRSYWSSGERLTPFVGRQQELALLRDRWERVKEGHGQAVLLSAEAGMGKSRLVQVLKAELADEPHTWLQGGCRAHHENSAFHAVVELLEASLELAGAADAEEKLSKLEDSLREDAQPVAEALPLFAKLLSLPPPERPPAQALSREAERRMTLDLLAAWVVALTAKEPVVLVVEDLHWSDPSTRDMLGRLLEEVPDVPLFVILDTRPGFETHWLKRSQLTRLTLHPLTRRQIETMIGGIAAGKPLRSTLVERVATRTDGVPLFVEELTKALLESRPVGADDATEGRSEPRPASEIPATLQSSLMARLDRLGRAKEVAQLAAVIGREFSRDLLADLSRLDSAALDAALDSLVHAELLYRRGMPPRSSYVFKHALIQDTAYQSLLKQTRRQFHARIAEALEERFPERVAAEPEVVAHHFVEAKLPARAIPCLQRASELAIARAANNEAIGHLSRAVEVIHALPEDLERDRQELALHVALAAPLVAAKGYASSEVERVYARARDLCDRIGDTPQLFRVLYGSSALYESRGELDTALAYGDRLLALAEENGDTSHLIEAHLALGMATFWKGERAAALAHFERAIDLYEPAEHRQLAYLYGLDPGVASRSFGAQAAWYLGHHDRAERWSREAVALGREAGQPYSLAYAVGFAGMVAYLRREPERALELTGEAIEIAETQCFPMIQSICHLVHAWAVAVSVPGGDAGEGADRSRGELRDTGLGVGAPLVLGALAEIYQHLGRLDDAESAVARGLTAAQRSHEHYWDAELLRLQAEILLQRDPAAVDEAESILRRAVELAREQGARSLELRAAMSLCRLLAQSERRRDARELLAQQHGGFSEGFDSPELRQAGDLLKELA